MALKMLEDEYSGKTPDRTIKNESFMVKRTIEQPYLTTSNTFLSTCHPVTHTSFVMHLICEHVWTLIQIHSKLPSQICKMNHVHCNPPNEHLTFGTSLWFSLTVTTWLALASFVLPQHVYACEHLSWSTQHFSYVVLKGAGGVSVLSLRCGWHRSDGADSLSCSLSVSRSHYTIPHQNTHYF